MPGPIRRRLAATRHVWRRGNAHLRILAGSAPPAPEPPAPEPEEAVREPEPERSGLIGGSVDLPLWNSVIPRGLIFFRGWALFDGGIASKVEIWLDDVFLGRARLGALRVDIERDTGLPAAVLSGYEHTVDLAEFAVP